MTAYPSTENLFTRDEETHKLNMGDFRRPDFAQVGNWHITEKIDGTNIRVILDWAYDEELDLWRPVVDVRGRTDAASLPKNFVQEAFGVEEPYELTDKLLSALAAITGLNVLDLTLDPVMVVVYGEGYGPGIQKVGSQYTSKKSFRAFDVRTFKGIVENGHWGHGLWRTWEDVEVVSNILGVETVPVFGSEESLDQIVKFVSNGVESVVASKDAGTYGIPAEGVVARTDPYLYDYRGNRVMWKLKGKDLP